MLARKWIAAIALAGCISGVVDAATRRVPQQYSSIQAAVDAASAGDTVLVGPGHYVENVLIQKSLKLRSTGGASLTTIDGNEIGTPLAALGSLTENVTISGFTLTGGAFLLDSVEVGYPNQWGAGLFIDSVATANVFDNVVVANRGCSGTGIRAYQSNIHIHDNIVRGNDPMDWCPNSGEAMRLVGSANLIDTLSAAIDGNQIVGNRGVGLSMTAFNNAAVRGNEILENGIDLESGPVGGGMELLSVGGVIAENFVARNFGFQSPALSVQNYANPANPLLIVGNRFVDNRAIAVAGALWLATFDPSIVYFAGNRVVGSFAGELARCDDSPVAFFGNVIINRDPVGSVGNCGH